MSLRLYGTISGCGRSSGAVIPALGSGRYAPGPNIVLPSWLKGSDPNFTINGFWGQPGALATVSIFITLPGDAGGGITPSISMLSTKASSRMRQFWEIQPDS